MFVYKILSEQEWESAKTTAMYAGSALDQKDGFIHLSTQEQLPQTLALYFKNQEGLRLLSFLANDLEELKWEKSRNDLLFPHLYADLPMDKCVESWILALAHNGVPILPFRPLNAD